MRTESPVSHILILFFTALSILGYATGQTGIPVEDGGEFLTVARLGGVSHPPGMPLLSLSAGVSWFLFGREGLRILFAVLAAATLLLLHRRRTVPAALFAAGALLLPGVSGRLLMWDAYGPLILVFAVAFLRSPPLSLEGGYLTGIAMAVHPQGILLPILCRWKEPSPLKFLGGFLLGLSLYLALPLGSAAGTIVDWGSTGGLANFLRQVSAGGYREVYGGSMGSISPDVLGRYLGSLWLILRPVLIVPALLGAISLYRRRGGGTLLLKLSALLLMDLLFVALVNPMAAGTTQTATISLLVVIILSFQGVRLLEKWKRTAGLAAGLAAVAAGVVLWQPLPDQTALVHEYFSQAPPQAAFFLRNNDLLYGGWVMKYVDDRRPDIVLLSPGNFSGWFEDMAMFFNPDIDLSKGVLDVGDFSMPREELSILLMNATIEDNPHRRFFCDF
ncbi:MAG: hypothetical protein JXA64_03960 [Candidatus Fermentibacteraceae bacterium]|nr:hypothetical protein [Candidatus Fermentibacteraceae bacterium]MBN2608247.1 hypothetical protein [Candidatus Fermentibacteraceae bacterium]